MVEELGTGLHWSWGVAGGGGGENYRVLFGCVELGKMMGCV